MSYRKSMSKTRSKKLFSKTADRVHIKNVKYNNNPMRGGYRL